MADDYSKYTYDDVADMSADELAAMYANLDVGDDDLERSINETSATLAESISECVDVNDAYMKGKCTDQSPHHSWTEPLSVELGLQFSVLKVSTNVHTAPKVLSAKRS